MKHHPALVAALVVFACTTNRDHAAIDTSASRATRIATAGDSNARIDTTGTPPSSQSQWHRKSETPVGVKYVLILSRDQDSVSHVVTLRIQLAERENRERVIDITTLTERDVSHKVLRGDSTFVVISRMGDYRPDLSFKLFLDPASKMLLKKIDFSPYAGLDSVPDSEAAIALGVPDTLVKALKNTDPARKPDEPWDARLPAALREHPMPKPTYKEFARVRPDAVETGNDEKTYISDVPGPFQVVGDRIWFGKVFYEGEGSSGVGGVGYFDTTRSTYTFLKVPELTGWSVSALLVEDQTLWIGLVGRGEGGGSPGGLVRHDLNTGATQKYAVDEAILRMKRWDNRLYLSTTNGLWVLENDRLTARYVAEPGFDGKLGLVRIPPATPSISTQR